MRIFCILDRYIGKNILTTIIIVLFILISLSGVIKFIDQLKKIGHGSYNVFGAGVYTICNVPKDLQIFFPVSALLGVMFRLGTMIKTRELIIMQASGFTHIQIVLSVMKTSIPLVMLAMLVGELIAPNCEQLAYNYRTQAIYGGSLLSTQQGIWVKHGNDFIYIKHIKENYELRDISIYVFDKHILQFIYYANNAKFDTKHKLWILSQVYKLNLTNIKHITRSYMLSIIWNNSLTPEKFEFMIIDPDALSIKSLHKYIQYLKSEGQDYTRYQVNMWSKIFHPLSIIVMMLIALYFIFGMIYNFTINMRIVTGISFGFIFYIFNKTFPHIALIYNIPPIICVILPNIIFLFISLWLLMKHINLQFIKLLY